MKTLLVVSLFICTQVGADANWPQWRGPSGNGVSAATGLPVTWSSTENVSWVAPLPSWGGASPIVWENRVFVTSPSVSAGGGEPTAEGQDPGGDELLLLCLSRTDGHELWRRPLGTGNRFHRKHNDSSPSPVTDGKRVCAVTGAAVVSAFDMSGEPMWRRDLQADYGALGTVFGYGSSPLLTGDTLILQVLHGYHTDDPSYLVALDAATGETLWREERATDAVAESPDAYTTPALIQREGGSEIVIAGGDYVTGHDPVTGAELWRRGGLNPEKRRNYRVVGSPVVAGDMLFVPTRKKPLQAFRILPAAEMSGSGPLWIWTGAGSPDVPTPVAGGGYFYMVDDRGLVTCLDAVTGAVVWGPHRTAEGIVSSSPVLADGKLYVTNENGITTVLAAGAELAPLAVNELDGSYTLSSMAVARDQLFIRTATHLYCIADVN